ncbi:MAG: hypothetical protein GKR98_10565 [Boseongicola sp.]|nr:MAG: hypothetical protein GKR98_10565 [Boseongicola sp.]
MLEMPNGLSTAGLEYYRVRANQLSTRMNNSGGKLAGYLRWQLSYCQKPFLFFDTHEEAKRRFHDAALSVNFLGSEGKIEIRAPDDRFWHKVWNAFVEATVELDRRHIDLKKIQAELGPIAPYFGKGQPIGVRILNGIKFEPFQCLVKFSRREFVDDMMRYGRFRIAPASSYNSSAFNRATKDLEIERKFRVPLISEYMAGDETVSVNGQEVPTSQGYVPVSFTLPDYYPFSTCAAAERRLATDFDADAALIVRDTKAFIARMKNALNYAFPLWECIARPVTYYDPYKDAPSDPDQEFYKHFSYAYQVEHRIILRPRGVMHFSNLEPFFVELGNLDGIAEALLP